MILQSGLHCYYKITTEDNGNKPTGDKDKRFIQRHALFIRSCFLFLKQRKSYLQCRKSFRKEQDPFQSAEVCRLNITQRIAVIRILTGISRFRISRFVLKPAINAQIPTTISPLKILEPIILLTAISLLPASAALMLTEAPGHWFPWQRS